MRASVCMHAHTRTHVHVQSSLLASMGAPGPRGTDSLESYACATVNRLIESCACARLRVRTRLEYESSSGRTPQHAHTRTNTAEEDAAHAHLHEGKQDACCVRIPCSAHIHWVLHQMWGQLVHLRAHTHTASARVGSADGALRMEAMSQPVGAGICCLHMPLLSLLFNCSPRPPHTAPLKRIPSLPPDRHVQGDDMCRVMTRAG